MSQRIERTSTGITMNDKVRLKPNWYLNHGLPVPEHIITRFVTDIRIYEDQSIEVETCYEIGEGPCYIRFSEYDLEIVG